MTEKGSDYGCFQQRERGNSGVGEVRCLPKSLQFPACTILTDMSNSFKNYGNCKMVECWNVLLETLSNLQNNILWIDWKEIIMIRQLCPQKHLPKMTWVSLGIIRLVSNLLHTALKRVCWPHFLQEKVIHYICNLICYLFDNVIVNLLDFSDSEYTLCQLSYLIRSKCRAGHSLWTSLGMQLLTNCRENPSSPNVSTAGCNS